MGEFAELTQIQQDDQSYTVFFPKLDKRETVPAASHWHRVGATPKQHTKENQQVHSTPNAKLPKAKVTCISRISPSLKLTLALKNRFLPLQESTNAPATHAPLSPEMRPDGQCGQRRNKNKNQSPWRQAAHASATCAPLTPEMCPDRRYGQRRNNQSPRRRAAHVSATVQQGPISEKADEPDTLIIGDSTIKDITGGAASLYLRPTARHGKPCHTLLLHDTLRGAQIDPGARISQYINAPVQNFMHKAPADLPWHEDTTSISKPQHAEPNASHAPATSISRPQHAEPNASHAPATSISRPQHAEPNASQAPATSISRPQHAEPNASHAPATSIQNKTCAEDHLLLLQLSSEQEEHQTAHKKAALL
ncbi:unnamed protein product [Gadus morhua 'NCC']